MWRVSLALIVIGGFLCYEGYKEYSVSRGAESEPLVVALADLENGTTPENPYIRIEGHIPCDHEIVYEAQMPSGQTQPTSTTKLTHCYYPIVSLEHPFAVQLTEIVEEGDWQNAILPPVGEYRVLVKTHRITEYGQLEAGTYVLPDTLEGLIINRIAKLSDDEQSYLRQGFPQLDFDNILILEDGRTPASSAKWGGMLGGGGVLILLGIFLILKPMLSGGSGNRQGVVAASNADDIAS